MRLARASWYAALLLFVFSNMSCVEKAEAIDYGDPRASLNKVTVVGGIAAYLVSPPVLQVFQEPQVELVIAAWTPDVPLPMDVRVQDADGREYATLARGALGEDQRFYATVPLLHGKNRLTIRVATADGTRVRRLEYVAEYVGAAPGIHVGVAAGPSSDDPCTDAVPLTRGVTGKHAVCVLGLASRGEADIATAAVQVGASADVPASLSPDGHFQAKIALEANVTAELKVTVTDVAGRHSSATAKVIQDSTPPTLTIAAGAPTRTDALNLQVKGTVSDEYGVATLALKNALGYERRLIVEPEWETEIRLEPGQNDFTFIAHDIAGNEAQAKISIFRDRLIRLEAPSVNSTAELNLDRRAIEELLTVDDQHDIEVVHIGLRPAIIEALKAIREPERIGVNTAEWGQAEWNLHRLLNMTPDTANLTGTSIAEMIQIASGVGLPPARLLGDLLSIEVTKTFVDVEVVADVVLEQLIGTHPNIFRNATTNEPELRLTMYDVLQELRTLAPRFGPVGDHPGFLVGESYSAVFEPGFLMSIPIQSNLKQFDGVDASGGRKDYLFALQGENVLKFDFFSDRFSAVGMVDEPTVNLRFVMHESANFIRAGDSQMAGADNEKPGFYRGNSAVWGVQPWLLERVVAETGYQLYAELYKDKDYKTELKYSTGAIQNAAVINWNRGWVDIHTSGGIGDPPKPLYLWDMLTEVAQVRLHEGGLAEGKADVAFRLDRLPIGLTAEELIDALRPTMQSQEAKLSERLVGSNAIAVSACDFYYVPAASNGYLFFRAASDSGGTYNYKNPGFFRDATLTNRASTKAALETNDTTHEKILARAGDVLYLEDDTQQRYRLEITSADSSGISVRIFAEGNP